MKNKPLIQEIEDFAIVMDENDNIAVAKKTIEKGVIFKFGENNIVIKQHVSAGHRFALRNIKKGQRLLQYNNPFGVSTGILQGELVSEKNVKEYRYSDRQLEFLAKNKKTIKIKNSGYIRSRFFWGIKRKGGMVGTRNYYVVMPTSLCASDLALKIARSLDNKKVLGKNKNINGIVAAAHTEGCGCSDGDVIDRLVLTLKNTIAHPNVGGALVIDLGCEKTNRSYISDFFKNLSKLGKPVDYLSIIETGGTKKSYERARNIIFKRLKAVNRVKREKVSIDKLIIGTECGASDTFSGITANPLIGAVADRVVDSGGSVILSETPEMIGAEKILIDRMASRNVALKFLSGMNYYKNLAKKLNVSMDGNFVPGNRKGGLINLTLKSLGAILKGGSRPIVDFIDYACKIRRKGLSIMNGPGNDLESMTGLVACGANIILFSTGLGTPEGNLIVPVIKIPTTTHVYERLKDDMDFNAGVLIDKKVSLTDVAGKLLNKVVDVASGEKTRSEINKKRSFQIWTAGKLTL